MTKNFTSEVRPVPPIGGFQEVGGRRVFVHEMGSGGPAVVFLPGSGAVGLDYFAVQQGVSQFSTAVVYDRCGTGYSDPVTLPRTGAAVVTELHELLHVRDIAAPYVLVAHSLGGAYAQRFTQMHPREVAGLVWVDGFHRDWEKFMPLVTREQTAPDPEQIRPALRAMYAELVADYPQHMRLPLIEAHVRDAWLRVGAIERGNLVVLTDELRAGPELPDVPVVALTAEYTDLGPQAPMPEQTVRALQEGMRRMAAAVASTVSHGEHRAVSGVGHNQMCFTRPDVVVQAIRDVFDRAAPA